MSDLLSAAAAALGIPEALIERSAAARATAGGTSVDDVLAAWAGGAPVATAAAPAPAAPAAAAAPMAAEPAVAPAPAAVTTIEAPPPPPAVIEVEPEPAEPIEPVPIGRRIRTATRVGAWTGAALGLFGFLVASTAWAINASVTGEDPYTSVIVADSTGVIIGVAAVSLLFGAIVAGLSRASAAWTNPGMRLSTSPRSTAWLGAFVGVVFGVIAAAILTGGFGTEIEGSEGLVELPVLATLMVMIIGGALLGAVTAAITQALGIPVAVEGEDEEEIAAVKGRLTGALTVPVVGLLLLLLLALPFAWALIESNELTAAGAPVVALITAAGILGFAALAGSKPNMKITFGEAMVAVIGIATVIIIIFAVLLAQSPAEHEESGDSQEAAVVQIVG